MIGQHIRWTFYLQLGTEWIFCGSFPQRAQAEAAMRVVWDQHDHRFVVALYKEHLPAQTIPGDWSERITDLPAERDF